MIVYAGAIMVLFLFVLMLLNVQREEDVARPRRPRARGRSRVVLVALLARPGRRRALAPTLGAGGRASTPPRAGWPQILFSPHFLYVFEATSILILAALVGAVALAKKDA